MFIQEFDTNTIFYYEIGKLRVRDLFKIRVNYRPLIYRHDIMFRIKAIIEFFLEFFNAE